MATLNQKPFAITRSPTEIWKTSKHRNIQDFYSCRTGKNISFVQVDKPHFADNHFSVQEFRLTEKNPEYSFDNLKDKKVLSTFHQLLRLDRNFLFMEAARLKTFFAVPGVRQQNFHIEFERLQFERKDLKNRIQSHQVYGARQKKVSSSRHLTGNGTSHQHWACCYRWLKE